MGVLAQQSRNAKWYTCGDVTTTSTTGADITGLAFTAGANTNYGVSVYLKTNVNSGTAGIKYQFTGPASPTQILFRVNGTTTGDQTVTIDTITAFSTLGVAFNTVAGDGGIGMIGIISNGANSGVVQLQFAKVTSQTAKVYAGSWMQVVEMLP